MADAETLRKNAEDLLVRVIADGDLDAIPGLVHPDFVNHEAHDDHRRHGQHGYRANAEALRSHFGVITWEVHRTLVDGDMAATYVTMRGGSEGGAARHVHLWRFADDGRALEHWAVRDERS